VSPPSTGKARASRIGTDNGEGEARVDRRGGGGLSAFHAPLRPPTGGGTTIAVEASEVAFMRSFSSRVGHLYRYEATAGSI
jgi:hypothetical protein